MYNSEYKLRLIWTDRMTWQTQRWDDDNPPNYGRGGYCYIQPGDTFNHDRYVAQKKLGWGSCSTVWLAWDTHNSQYVSLKVQTDNLTIRPKAEIQTLEKLASRDQQNQRCVVKLLDHFVHTAQRRSYVCLVFEYLGDSLIKLIKCYGPKGLPLRLVKHICLHILDGLDYLHTEFSLIHGNIEPDNICLLSTINPSDDPLKSGASPILPPKKSSDKEETSKIAESCTSSLGHLVLSHDDESRKSCDDLIGNPDVNSVELRQSHDDLMGNPDVNYVESTKSHVLMGNRKELLESLDPRCKLIDFGHVCSAGNGDHDSISMAYRPPEVIFGDGPSLSTSADLWSFACVCFELATGQYLFPAQLGDEYNRDEDHLALMKQHLDRIPPAMIELSKSFCRKWFDTKGRLKNVPTRKRWTIKERLVEDYNFNEKDATELGDFLKWVLKYEPTERPTAAKCRRHKWFNDVREEHFISTRKESGPREETKLKNVNVAEGEHFTAKSKENGETGKSEPMNENISSGGCRKNAKTKRRRDRRLHPSI